MTRSSKETLTQRLYRFWRSDEAKDKTPRQAAQEIIPTLTMEDLTWIAQEWIAGSYARVQRVYTTRTEKASITKFRDFVPDPFVAASGLPAATPKGKAARQIADEKAAAAEARRLNERDKIFALQARTRVLTSDYADAHKFEVTKELLSSMIEIGDGTERELGSVTVDEWRARVTRGEAAIVGNLATVGREKAYLKMIEDAGKTTLNEVVAAKLVVV